MKSPENGRKAAAVEETFQKFRGNHHRGLEGLGILRREVEMHRWNPIRRVQSQQEGKKADKRSYRRRGKLRRY